MIKRGNPIGIEATGQITVDLEEQMKDLHQRIRDAEEDRSSWIQKQAVLVKQRRGLREKKTIPWIGANNDNIPLTEGVIRRWKPTIGSLVIDADPVAYFFATKPQDMGTAKDAQTYYHWKFHQIPGVVKTVAKLTDYLAQYGIAWTRQGWCYKTDRTCRIVSAAELFPGGVQQAAAQANQQIQAQNAQIDAAIEAGQVPPDTPRQPPLTPDQYVRLVLKQEYEVSEQDHGFEQSVQMLLQGAEYVKLYYESVREDRPDWAALNPLDVLVPSRSREDGVYDFLAIVHRMSADDIQRSVRDGIFKADAAPAVLERMRANEQSSLDIESTTFDGRTTSARTSLNQALRELEGAEFETSLSKHAPYEVIWELYCKLDINGDGILERCVAWFHPETKTILSVFEYPYPFCEWPITKFEFEHTSDRPYQARGICELLSTFQKLTNKIHNSRLDAIQILLSPMLKLRAGAKQLNLNIKYRPGTIVPLQNVDDLQPLIQDFRPLTQFLQEENYTKSLAEQFIGVFDQSVLAQQRSERRTATEVEAITAQISVVLGGDATLFQTSMAQVHKQLWQLILDFGPAEEYYRVMGEEMPKLIRKSEINRNFDIFPAGTPANTNKALALARAREMMQLFMQDMTGLINKEVLYRNYVDLMDRNLSKALVRDENQAAAVQQVLAAAQAASGAKQPPMAF